MIVIYYEVDTGRATHILSAPDLAAFPQPSPGLQAIMWPVSVGLPGYVENLEYVEVSDPPSPIHVFNWVLKVWEDPRTLNDIKSSARREIVRRRDAVEFGPFTYAGVVFDGNADAQRRLSGCASAAKSAIAAGHTFNKEYTLADNSVVTLSAEDFVGIEMAKIFQVDLAFQTARERQALIESATTVEQVEAVLAMGD